MRAHGKTYNQGSEKKWPEWAPPPVTCRECGERVTLKQSFCQDRERGTRHAACSPGRVRVLVEAR